ncbi:nuclear transport factor 2 family protein [Cecembia lonarensis]|uniref:nuclear transport factor 2 family protein n=1 Tax=Cecembia lonarensis TaxID=645110 RepID=UPI00058D1A34|nr:nuclear transport factor 2 family protein [Cecembia lonarensis]
MGVFQHALNTSLLFGQHQVSGQDQIKILTLIDEYSKARENQDTLLLKSILTTEVDQLVSSGEWRTGISEAMYGMQRSSANNPGQRQLKVEKTRLLNETCAIVDARYEIIGDNEAPTRRMWSTFLVIKEGENWKIAGIRNMMPAR